MTTLDRLVQSLCVIGTGSAEPVGLLVQKNARDAVVVLQGYGDILILMETGEGPVAADELEKRIPAAIGTEREDVVAGLATQYSVILRIVTPGSIPAPAPSTASPGLPRPFGILRLDHAGVSIEHVIEVPGRQSRQDLLERLRDTVDTAHRAAPPAACAPTAGSLAAAEARGETVVAREGAFARFKQRPPGVIGITTLLVVIHLTSWFTWEHGSTQAALRMGGNLGELVRDGEWFRVITAGYLHQDVAHLLTNLVLFWIFGCFVEAAFGTGRFLFGYTFLVGASEGITALIRPEQVGYGASGGILGLVALVAMMNWKGSQRSPPFSGSGWGCFGVILLTNELLHALDPKTSFVAHFGGALAGAALGATRLLELGLGPLESDSRASRQRPADWLMGLAALGITLYAHGVAYSRYHPWSFHAPPSMETVRWDDVQLEARVPAPLLLRQSHETSEHYTLHRAGDARLDLLVLSLLQRDHSFADDDAEAARVHLRDTLEAEGHTVDPSAITMVPMGDRTMAAWRSPAADHPLLRFLGAIGGREVDVMVSLANRAPDGWTTLAHESVASLKRFRRAPETAASAPPENGDAPFVARVRRIAALGAGPDRDALIASATAAMQPGLDSLITRADLTRALPLVCDMATRDDDPVKGFARELWARMIDQGLVTAEDVGSFIDDPRPRMRDLGLRSIKRLGARGETLMPRLYAELKSPKKEIREKTIERLCELDRPPAELLDALRPLVTDPSEDVREEVAEALGEIATVPSLEILITMLEDRSPEVREEAQKALDRNKARRP